MTPSIDATWSLDELNDLAEHRRLVWEGCLNVRDLGGLPTAHDRLTQWGTVVRSDSPNLLTEAGRAALQAYDIRTVVDLRLPNEARESAYSLVGSESRRIAYHHLSFIDPEIPPPDTEITSLADDYKGMLDRFGHRVAAINRTIASAPEGCVLVHCVAGKDRTGLITALLLDLVGVPHHVIAADYALSGEWRRPITDEWLANGPGTRAEREDGLRYYWPRPEVMLEVLAYLGQRYGGAEGYLRHANLTEAEIAQLRDRLV